MSVRPGSFPGGERRDVIQVLTIECSSGCEVTLADVNARRLVQDLREKGHLPKEE